MALSLLWYFDIIGTIAFAISGAFVGIRREMDIFGVNVLAVCTACGGGCIRDLVIGRVPPVMFTHPRYVLIAAVAANIVFLFVAANRYKEMPVNLVNLYDRMMFWFDTLGLGAFTVDGIMAGMNAGYEENVFLLVFLGVVTAAGGGALRDVLANQMPYIFVKHVYAIASIAGGIVMMLIIHFMGDQWHQMSMIVGFLVVIVLRYFANRYKWNLPKIDKSVQKTQI